MYLNPSTISGIIMYDIIVRFPSKKMAEDWTGQMCDGFGEGFCDFTPWQQKLGTDGKKREHFERVTGAAPEGTEVWFMKSMEEY